MITLYNPSTGQYATSNSGTTDAQTQAALATGWQIVGNQTTNQPTNQTTSSPTQNGSVLFSAYGYNVMSNATQSLITAPDGSNRPAVKWTNPDGSYVWEILSGSNVQKYAPQYYKTTSTSTATPTPAPVTQPTPTTQSQTTPQTYTVKSGDTLSAIAQKNGITLQQLLQQNPQFQANPNLIQPGQTVNLGTSATVTPTAPPTTTPASTTATPITDPVMQNFVNLMVDLVPTANGYTSKTTGQVYSTEAVMTAVANNVAPTLINSGVTVNPEVLKLTSFEDFMTQASSTIDPYYKSQFDQIKNVLTTKLGQLGEDLTKKKEELQRTSAENLRTGGETLAGRGLTFSGQRQTFDTESKQDLSRALDLANTSVYRSGQDLLTQAESKIGTSNLQGISTNLGGRNLSFGNVSGEMPYQRYADVFNRAQVLSADENARRQYAWNLQNTSA